MKVSINWLKELVNLNCSVEELVKLLPLRTIGIKEVTPDFIDLDMKGYNRADLLSMRGVAYEAAAITNSEIKFPDDEAKTGIDIPKTKVEVKDSKLSPVYCIAKIENLKVEHSNETWVKKLNDSGIRAINNIADVTNLIMMEYGQPMHAFDANKVSDETLIVRTAKAGETITTLDGKVRKLESLDLLIADPQKAVGIAGIMGGQNSEVTDSTTTILLEAAIFDAVNIRKTAQRLGLPSEASKRFQHGLTKKRLLQALNASIKMYQKLGGKLTAITFVGDFEDKVKTIRLTQQKINSLIGIEIKPADLEGYLQKLGFILTAKDQSWEVQVPYWRLDINIEEDLIEEITRIYGFEKIPAKELPEVANKQKIDPIFELIENIKTKLVEVGLTEVQTYSFYSTSVLSNLDWSKDKLVKIANPISSETQYLREDLWPNLLEVVAKNIRNGFKDVAIFELGKVYSLQKGGLPKESYRLSIALSNNSDNPIQELYQIFQGLGSNLKGYKLNLKYFHPTRISLREGIGEIHPRFVNKFGIEKRVAVLEITIS